MNINLSPHSFIPSSPHPFIPFLIPYATNTKAALLIAAGAVHIGSVVDQLAVPSDVRIVLWTTPPVTEVANDVVGSIEVAETAREACET